MAVRAVADAGGDPAKDLNVDAVISIADSDGDGKINFEEFKEFVESDASSGQSEEATRWDQGAAHLTCMVTNSYMRRCNADG
jgi:hypothetical protein